MIEKILEWGGRIFVIVGIICLFAEAVTSIRRRSNTKLSIVGIVFLSISVVGYIVTELILRSLDLSIAFQVVWIACLWAYLICNLISAILISRRKRKLDELARKVELYSVGPTYDNYRDYLDNDDEEDDDDDEDDD